MISTVTETCTYNALAVPTVGVKIRRTVKVDRWLCNSPNQIKQIIELGVIGGLIAASFFPDFPRLQLFNQTSFNSSFQSNLHFRGSGLPACPSDDIFIYLFVFGKGVGGGSLLPNTNLDHERPSARKPFTV